MRRLLAVAAGVAALATTAPAYAQGSGGRVPPSGSIAFTEGNGSSGGIYTVQPSGASLDFLTGGLLPSFSPNGSKLAAVGLNGAVYVTSVNGKGGSKQVASQAGIGLNYGPAAWSPNGKQLAYTSGGNVYVVNASGGKPKRIYSQGEFENEATHPVFSKSGKTVYFIILDEAVSAEVPVYQVMSASASGSGTPAAIQPKIPPATPYWGLTPFSLSLSPSGNTLAVTMAQRAVPPPGQSSAPYAAFAVGLWPLGTGGSVSVLPGFSAAAWAPNGTQLCANDSSGNLDVIDTSGNVDSTPVQASIDPAACTWVP